MTQTVYTLNRELIKSIMLDKKISSSELDVRCDFLKGMTSRILNKKAQNFTIDTLMKIHEVLGASLDELIAEEPKLKYIRYDKRKPKTYKK